MNNNRYQCLRFNVSCNSVLHGFAGYFETTLYKDVMLSKYHFLGANIFMFHHLYTGICAVNLLHQINIGYGDFDHILLCGLQEV